MAKCVTPDIAFVNGMRHSLTIERTVVCYPYGTKKNLLNLKINIQVLITDISDKRNKIINNNISTGAMIQNRKVYNLN